jgi:transposase
LREVERLQGQGMTIPQVCKRLQVSEQTFKAATSPAVADATDAVPLR